MESIGNFLKNLFGGAKKDIQQIAEDTQETISGLWSGIKAIGKQLLGIESKESREKSEKINELYNDFDRVFVKDQTILTKYGAQNFEEAEKIIRQKMKDAYAQVSPNMPYAVENFMNIRENIERFDNTSYQVAWNISNYFGELDKKIDEIAQYDPNSPLIQRYQQTKQKIFDWFTTEGKQDVLSINKILDNHELGNLRRDINKKLVEIAAENAGPLLKPYYAVSGFLSDTIGHAFTAAGRLAEAGAAAVYKAFGDDEKAEIATTKDAGWILRNVKDVDDFGLAILRGMEPGVSFVTSLFTPGIVGNVAKGISAIKKIHDAVQNNRLPAGLQKSLESVFVGTNVNAALMPHVEPTGFDALLDITGGIVEGLYRYLNQSGVKTAPIVEDILEKLETIENSDTRRTFKQVVKLHSTLKSVKQDPQTDETTDIVARNLKNITEPNEDKIKEAIPEGLKEDVVIDKKKAIEALRENNKQKLFDSIYTEKTIKQAPIRVFDDEDFAKYFSFAIKDVANDINNFKSKIGDFVKVEEIEEAKRLMPNDPVKGYLIDKTLKIKDPDEFFSLIKTDYDLETLKKTRQVIDNAINDFVSGNFKVNIPKEIFQNDTLEGGLKNTIKYVVNKYLETNKIEKVDNDMIELAFRHPLVKKLEKDQSIIVSQVEHIKPALRKLQTAIDKGLKLTLEVTNNKELIPAIEQGAPFILQESAQLPYLLKHAPYLKKVNYEVNPDLPAYSLSKEDLQALNAAGIFIFDGKIYYKSGEFNPNTYKEIQKDLREFVEKNPKMKEYLEKISGDQPLDKTLIPLMKHLLEGRRFFFYDFALFKEEEIVRIKEIFEKEGLLNESFIKKTVFKPILDAFVQDSKRIEKILSQIKIEGDLFEFLLGTPKILSERIYDTIYKHLNQSEQKIFDAYMINFKEDLAQFIDGHSPAYKALFNGPAYYAYVYTFLIQNGYTLDNIPSLIDIYVKYLKGEDTNINLALTMHALFNRMSNNLAALAVKGVPYYITKAEKVLKGKFDPQVKLFVGMLLDLKDFAIKEAGDKFITDGYIYGHKILDLVRFVNDELFGEDVKEIVLNAVNLYHKKVIKLDKKTLIDMSVIKAKDIIKTGIKMLNAVDFVLTFKRPQYLRNLVETVGDTLKTLGKLQTNKFGDEMAIEFLGKVVNTLKSKNKKFDQIIEELKQMLSPYYSKLIDEHIEEIKSVKGKIEDYVQYVVDNQFDNLLNYYGYYPKPFFYKTPDGDIYKAFAVVDKEFHKTILKNHIMEDLYFDLKQYLDIEQEYLSSDFEALIAHLYEKIKENPNFIQNYKKRLNEAKVALSQYLKDNGIKDANRFFEIFGFKVPVEKINKHVNNIINDIDFFLRQSYYKYGEDTVMLLKSKLAQYPYFDPMVFDSNIDVIEELAFVFKDYYGFEFSNVLQDITGIKLTLRDLIDNIPTKKITPNPNLLYCE